MTVKSSIIREETEKKHTEYFADIHDNSGLTLKKIKLPVKTPKCGI